MTLSAPTTITLRRPSADADLIISRLDNSRHDNAVNSSRSSSSSARYDVVGRQVSFSAPGSASASSHEDTDCIDTDESRVRHVKNKKKNKKRKRAEERWKCGLRRASDCLRDVIKRCQQQLQVCNDKSESEVTLLTISDPHQSCVGRGQLRKVNIQMYSYDGGKGHRDKARSFNNLDLASRSSGVLPRRNLSTSMTLVELREGMFSAQIPLNTVSLYADVTVKVIDSSLELYVKDDVDDVKSSSATQRSSEGQYRGTIDLPNYVDAGRVEFDVIGQTLCMKAAMKGCSGHVTSQTSFSSHVKFSSTLDLTRLQRHDESSTRRRKSANDVNAIRMTPMSDVVDLPAS